MKRTRVFLVVAVLTTFAMSAGAEAQAFRDDDAKMVTSTMTAFLGVGSIVGGAVALSFDNSCNATVNGFCTERYRITDTGPVLMWGLIGGGAVISALAIWMFTWPVLGSEHDLRPDVAVSDRGAVLTLEGVF